MIQRFGPLVRSPEVEDATAAVDDRAVDQARDDGSDLPRGHGDHVLVEQGDAGADLSEGEQRLAAAQPAQGRKVGITKASGDVDHAPEHLARAFDVALHQGLQRGRDHQVAELDAVALSVI